MNAKVKDVLIRTGKTFIQAFASYLTVDVFFGVTDFNTAKKVALSLVMGAVAAGLCAVWNLFINWFNSYIEGLHTVTETYSEDEDDGEEYDTEPEGYEPEDGEDEDGDDDGE